MDEQSNVNSPSSEAVGFPTHTPTPPKKGVGKWIVFVILLLVILGGGIFFLLRSSNEAIETPTSTPNIRAIETIYTPPPESENESTPTPAPIDKSATKIQVLNGTGTAGDAGSAKTALAGIGYSDVETGNASSQTATATSVTVDSSIPESARTEIKTALEKIFASVTVSSGSVSGGFKIQITTGPKKGASSAASGTPRATTKATATPIGTPKPSATPQ